MLKKNHLANSFIIFRLNFKNNILKMNLSLLGLGFICINILWIIYTTVQVDLQQVRYGRLYSNLYYYQITINNFYLLFMSLFISKKIFFSIEAKHLISTEKRLGYNNAEIFWPRFINILLPIIITNLFMSVVGSLTLFNNQEYNELLFAKNVQHYFVLIFTSSVLVIFALMILMLLKFTRATLIIGIFCFGLFISSQMAKFLKSNSRGGLYLAHNEIRRGEKFFKAASEAGLTKIFDATNYIAGTEDYFSTAMNGEGEIGIKLETISDIELWFSLFKFEPLLRFYKTGQVLNTIKGSQENGVEQRMMYNLNPSLFYFFDDMYENLKNYQSDSNLIDIIFLATNNRSTKMIDLKPVINHLQNQNFFWSKYKNLFELLVEGIALEFKYSSSWINTNYVLIDTQFGGATKPMNFLDELPDYNQRIINNFYEQVPEFLILAQMFMIYWRDSMENTIISYNVKYLKNQDEIYIDNQTLEKNLSKSKYWSVFDFSNFWSLLFSTSSWTNGFVPIDLNSYVYTNHAYDFKNLKHIFEEDFYHSNIYKQSYFEEAGTNYVKQRSWIIGVIYLQIIVLGLTMLGVTTWKFKNNHQI